MNLYIRKFKEIIEEVNKLGNRSDQAFDGIKKRAINLLIKSPLDDSKAKLIESIPIKDFFLSIEGAEFINVINMLIDELEIENEAIETLSDKKSIKSETVNKNQSISNKIFIVHGHNDLMKETVARTLERIGLEAIILHEQPNKGNTIIEKFKEYSNVGFAVILLSPDDIGYSKKDKPENRKYRARQNVIFEMGYFTGALGRNKVVVLYENKEEFEFPSDYQGVVYTSYDKDGKWQFDLIKELKAAEYEIDANKII